MTSAEAPERRWVPERAQEAGGSLHAGPLQARTRHLPRRLERLLRSKVVDLATTPHGADRYLRLVNPLWSLDGHRALLVDTHTARRGTSRPWCSTPGRTGAPTRLASGGTQSANAGAARAMLASAGPPAPPALRIPPPEGGRSPPTPRCSIRWWRTERPRTASRPEERGVICGTTKHDDGKGAGRRRRPRCTPARGTKPAEGGVPGAGRPQRR